MNRTSRTPVGMVSNVQIFSIDPETNTHIPLGSVEKGFMTMGYFDEMPEEEEPSGDIPIHLRDSDPFPPSVAKITQGFGTRQREFKEGYKVEIVQTFYDPTKEDKRSIVIRVIDERAPDNVKGAVACVSSHRLKLVG
jgi:hypothetical protein